MKIYGGRHTLEFSEGSHRYKIDGKYKYGVTTILGILGKEGLIQWSANMAVEAMLAGSIPQDAKYAWMKKRDVAGNVGTRVHEWIEEHIKGKDSEVSEDMKPSVSAFLRWEAETKPKYTDSERRIYSEQYDYAGTCDVVFVKDGVKYVADFKTSDPDKEFKKYYTGKVRARKEHFYQCALYDQAMIEEGDKPADKYMSIYISKDGQLKTFETGRTDELRRVALALVDFYKLDKIEDKENKYEAR